MKSRLSSLVKNLDSIIMCFFLCMIFLLLFAQVFMRYVVGRPLIWSEELARYSYVWITMLAFGYNQRTGNNVSMTLLSSRLPKLLQLILQFVTDLAVLVTCCAIFPSLVDFFRLNARMRSNVLDYSLGLVAVSLPIGFGLLIIFLAVHAFKQIADIRKGAWK